MNKKYFAMLLGLAILLSFGSDVYAAENPTKKQVNKEVSGFFNSIEKFRAKTYKDIVESRLETQTRIDLLEKISKSESLKNSKNQKILDSTEKPIAYIRLLMLSVAAFAFSSTYIFYFFVLVVIFLILRFLYFRIRHR